MYVHKELKSEIEIANELLSRLTLGHFLLLSLMGLFCNVDIIYIGTFIFRNLYWYLHFS